MQRAGGDLSKQHRRWICRESQRGSTMEMQARQGGSQQQTHLQEALLPLILPTLPQPAIITGTGTDFQASLGSCAVPPFCTGKPRQATCQTSFLSPASLISHETNFASSYSYDPQTNLPDRALPPADSPSLRPRAGPPLQGHRPNPPPTTLANSSGRSDGFAGFAEAAGYLCEAQAIAILPDIAYAGWLMRLSRLELPSGSRG